MGVRLRPKKQPFLQVPGSQAPTPQPKDLKPQPSQQYGVGFENVKLER